jgi:arabinose-5-phosphate isomerase
MEYNAEQVVNKLREKVLEECALVSETVKYIDDAFYEAVRTIMTCRGRLIITGVGKSGHIGRKIAASFSCLGTPCHFVHSDESLHGDLGAIHPDDVVIMISNSGKTDEVVKMLPSLRVIGAKTIAITKDNASPLAKKCDIALCVRVSREIDHLNLAPTASALAVLAVGDALAAAVAELKAFAREDFAIRHPLGALGQELLGEYNNAIKV